MSTETELPEAIVVLHPRWVERVHVEEIARVLMSWDRWLSVGHDRSGNPRFYAEPVPLLNIIPQRSGRA